MPIFAVKGPVKISESGTFANVEFCERSISVKNENNKKVVDLIYAQRRALLGKDIQPKYVILGIKEWESVCAVLSADSRIVLRPGDQIFGLEPIIIPFTDNFHHCVVVGSAQDMAQMAWLLVNDEERMLQEKD